MGSPREVHGGEWLVSPRCTERADIPLATEVSHRKIWKQNYQKLGEVCELTSFSSLLRP